MEANETTLPTNYQAFIHMSRYSRWLEDEQRRETWEETIDRYLSFMEEHLKKNYNYDLVGVELADIRRGMLNLEVLGSMRALMTAGPALARENVSGYNCSYLPVDSPRSFDECLYILMNGTGVGFSVERQYINNLPTIPNKEFENSDDVVSVADSKEGWARGLRDLISLLYTNRVPKIDVSKIRPAGARLKVFGGRASGPAPLEELFDFTIQTFKKAKGRKLNSLECHDIMCKVGQVVVVGGVRRSALISLSNLTDERMRMAKSGDWWVDNQQRALSNNSVCYTERPDMGIFMKEWLSLYESKSGERGIFNRVSAQQKAASNGRRDGNIDFGTNPCCEIILRPYQFCNLSEVICRADDTMVTLKNKIKLATILGTFQSTLTDFGYLRKRWKDTTEAERLLGVSLTGIMDCPTVYNATPEALQQLRDVAVKTNKKLAEKLGINQSTAVTCVKPSGTVSQLVDAASGIHARHNPYYVRTVRGDNKDPLTVFMKEKGVPYESDFTAPDSVTVFSFPMKSPKDAVCRYDMSALEQLELWLKIANNYCEHKPSVTISVKEHEWLEVGTWCWNNFDALSGISFLPFSDHSYKQAPYQDIDQNEYTKFLELMPPDIDWTELQMFERGDTTSGSQELACTGGVCEIVDIGA
jgi:ribonucleoside-diphosphate reductase alpha chain